MTRTKKRTKKLRQENSLPERTFSPPREDITSTSQALQKMSNISLPLLATPHKRILLLVALTISLVVLFRATLHSDDVQVSLRLPDEAAADQMAVDHQVIEANDEFIPFLDDEAKISADANIDVLPIPSNRFFKTSFEQQEPKYVKSVFKAHDIDTDQNKIIIMSSIAHAGAYGDKRTFKDFLNVIQAIEFHKPSSSLGLLVGTMEEYNKVVEFLEEYNEADFFSRVVVVHAQFLEELYQGDHLMRHALKVQKERRRAISRARNFLITSSLQDETYTLSIDADVVEIPKDLLALFISSGKDIIVPRVGKWYNDNYDRNSWAGERTEPNESESQMMDKNDPELLYVPRPNGDKTKLMHDFQNDPANNGTREFSARLDSVGGAVLFLKSVIFRQGVMFPPFYLIGTKWARFEGYDGIETEGLCYQARTIGYSCWGYPNVVALHVQENLLMDGQ
jgi:hypothetical protein